MDVYFLYEAFEAKAHSHRNKTSLSICLFGILFFPVGTATYLYENFFIPKELLFNYLEEEKLTSE